MTGDFTCCRMHFKLHAINSLWLAISVRVCVFLSLAFSLLCHFTYSYFHMLSYHGNKIITTLKEKERKKERTYFIITSILTFTSPYYASLHFTLLHLTYKTIHHFISFFYFCLVSLFVIVFTFNMIIL